MSIRRKLSAKLLALLVTTALLLALVPGLTFAAPNRFASSMSVDKTSVVADGTATIKITIYVADETNAPVEGAKVFAASERANTETFAPAGGTAPNTGGVATTDATGKAEITVKSNVRGAAKIGVSLGDSTKTDAVNIQELIQHLQGVAGYTAAAVNLIGTANVEFTAASVNSMTVAVAGSPATADGLTQITLTARALDAGGNPVPNVEVTFSVNKTGLSFDKATYVTDVFGRAVAKVTATKADTYKVTATGGGKTSSPADVVFTAGAVGYSIELVKEVPGPIATDQTSDYIKFKVSDINGNRIADAGLVTVEFTTVKPTGTAATLAAPSLDSQNNVQTRFTPDKEGTYEIRAKLANGKFVLTRVEAKKQGTITGLTMEYKPAYLAHNAVSAAPTLKYVDAAGVSRVLTNLERESLKFSASNYQLVKSITQGAGTGAAGGTVQATDSTTRKGTVTITAIDEAKNLVTTFNLSVGTEPLSIALSADAKRYAPESQATVTVQLKDADGSNIAYGVSDNTRTLAVSVISKPAGSIVTPTLPAGGVVDEDLEQKGNTTFKVTSNKEGNVVLQVTVGDGATSPKYLTNSITIEFAKPVAIPGAKSVTMFIGAKGYIADGAPGTMDAEPFIAQNRTFVPVRFLAEAFGATADWTPKDKPVTMVTLTRADIQISIYIGSNVIYVVKDGVQSTVQSDVAAFIVGGRTVLPFRAIAEAFGAEVDYGPKDAPVQWVRFTQK